MQRFEVVPGEGAFGFHHHHKDIVVAKVRGGLAVDGDTGVKGVDEGLARRVNIDGEAQWRNFDECRKCANAN